MTFTQDNIGPNFEISGWIIFFTITDIMCQILPKSDILRKNVGCPTNKKYIQVFVNQILNL